MKNLSPHPTRVALDWLNRQQLPDRLRNKVILRATEIAARQGDDTVLLHDVADALDERLRQRLKCSPVGWNDCNGRTYAEVHALLKELDI